MAESFLFSLQATASRFCRSGTSWARSTRRARPWPSPRWTGRRTSWQTSSSRGFPPSNSTGRRRTRSSITVLVSILFALALSDDEAPKLQFELSNESAVRPAPFSLFPYSEVGSRATRLEAADAPSAFSRNMQFCLNSRVGRNEGMKEGRRKRNAAFARG